MLRNNNNNYVRIKHKPKHKIEQRAGKTRCYDETFKTRESIIDCTQKILENHNITINKFIYDLQLCLNKFESFKNAGIFSVLCTNSSSW